MSELGLTGRAWCVVFSSYVAVRSPAGGVLFCVLSACRLLFGGGLEDSEEGMEGRGAKPPILPRKPINSHKIHPHTATVFFPFSLPQFPHTFYVLMASFVSNGQTRE